MRISKNFRLEEFKVSREHAALAAQTSFSMTEKNKVFYLVTTFLQPLRDKYGAVVILSGKRPYDLNRRVGGSVNSDHLYGSGYKAAVDFTIPSVDMLDVYNYIVNTYPLSCFGELIYYRKSNFIHLSLPNGISLGEAREVDK